MIDWRETLPVCYRNSVSPKEVIGEAGISFKYPGREIGVDGRLFLPQVAHYHVTFVTSKTQQYKTWYRAF
jgi:hypothetical protein